MAACSPLCITKDAYKLPTLKNKQGISLVEILFATLILTIIFVSAFSLAIQSMEVLQTADYQYEAFHIAKSRIERIKSVQDTSGFDSLTSANIDETDTLLDKNGSELPSGSEDLAMFKRSSSIIDVSGNSRLKKLTVTVSFKARGDWNTNNVITYPVFFTSVEQA